MTQPSNQLAVPGTSAAAEARARRNSLSWIGDEDLRTLERKEEAAAAALSFFLPGAGQIYTQDYLKGLGLMAGTIALVAATGWGALWVLMGLVASYLAFSNARAINRYVAARDAHAIEQGAAPAAYRLLTAMAATDPSAIAEAHAMKQQGTFGHVVGQHAGASVPTPAGGAVDVAPTGGAGSASVAEGLKLRLQKLAALRASEVITDAEYRERRIDSLSELKGLLRDQLDDVLFELLPLIDQGYLSQEDITFVKQMGGDV